MSFCYEIYVRIKRLRRAKSMHFHYFFLVGRIIIELFANVVPKTVENFLALCVGNHYSHNSGKKLHYKGTIFHKVIPGVFIQGGDVTNFDGSAGESIFGSPFEDENYELKVCLINICKILNHMF